MIAKRFFSVVKNLIEINLQSFNPKHLEVINESWMHEVGQDTHFKVIIVSDQFSGISSMKRMSLINKSLKEVWDKDVVTISLVAKTSEEYDLYKLNTFIYDYPSLA